MNYSYKEKRKEGSKVKTFNILALAVILSAAVATFAISQEQGTGAVAGEATEQVVAEGMDVAGEAAEMVADEAMNEEVMNEVMDEVEDAVEAVEAVEVVAPEAVK